MGKGTSIRELEENEKRAHREAVERLLGLGMSMLTAEERLGCYLKDASTEKILALVTKHEKKRK